MEKLNKLKKWSLDLNTAGSVTEYVIVVALVAIVCIMAYRSFGSAIVAKVQTQTTQIGGL